ncbi:MAG TPA: amylo-alpha-1,6-glucosidase [Sandaracinaceae bacterium]
MEQVEHEFPVGASAELADVDTRVLKHDDTFLVCDERGDLLARLHNQLGLFHDGMRHLSRYRLRVGGQRMLLLGSTVREDNALLAVSMMNPDMRDAAGREVPHGTLHLRRERLVFGAALYEELTLSNYGASELDLDVSFEIDADFVDLFEVRGTQRARRGTYAEPEANGRTLLLAYTGLDGVRRETRVELDREPRMADGALHLRLRLEPGGSERVRVTVRCATSTAPSGPALSFTEALARYDAQLEALAGDDCVIETSSSAFDEWIRRSQADLRMMVSATAHGPYPYAGVPWYSTPFGRDGILTALEALWVNPSLAAGVLEYLAARQATRVDESVDAEPGKILHETRGGEMAALGEVPFGCYYGSVDATPLFVLLAGRYHRATADTDRIRRLWPSIEAALRWMDEHGDRDGDGFVEYARKSPVGLVQQGWKDSHDSVFHADGSDAEGPIALCEVQGYVYAAKREAARLASVLGDEERARVLREQAHALRERFDQRFWSDELGTYALALDGAKRPCLVRTSNAGHCLFAGIARPERAAQVARALLSPAMFSGWGVRTVAKGERRYNPMSYHNGSVWPHDTAIVADGLARYGYGAQALALFEALHDVSARMELHRLPELICGFTRRRGEAPTLYPVACSPQAWAAAAVFLLLRACLGMRIDAERGRLSLVRPQLPAWLETVRLRNLRVGGDRVDLVLRRYPEDVALTVEQRTGPIEIVVVK